MVQRINRLNMNIDTIQKIQNHMGDALSKKLGLSLFHVGN